MDNLKVKFLMFVLTDSQQQKPKILEKLCIFFSHAIVVQSLSHVWLFAALWTVACQAPLSMGFSRQEYWSELPFPSPGDLPNPGIEPISPTSPALASRFFTTELPGKPNKGHEQLFTALENKVQLSRCANQGSWHSGPSRTCLTPHYLSTRLVIFAPAGLAHTTPRDSHPIPTDKLPPLF